MPDKIIWAIYFVLITVAVLFIIERTYRRYKFSAEISRKIAHVLTGLNSLIFIPLIDDALIIALISITAFIFLLVTKTGSALNSIHKVPRKSFGSVIFPLPFLICFLFANLENNAIYLYLPLLTFILADPAAASVGLRIPMISYTIWKQTKTISGSMAFFITTFLLSLILINHFLGPVISMLLVLSFMMALLSTLIEAVSPAGSDNLSVPIVQLILLKFIMILV
jgi:phytol kinase